MFRFFNLRGGKGNFNFDRNRKARRRFSLPIYAKRTQNNTMERKKKKKEKHVYNQILDFPFPETCVGVARPVLNFL